MMRWSKLDNAGLRPALFFELIRLDFSNLYSEMSSIMNMESVLGECGIDDSFLFYLQDLIDSFFSPFIIYEMILQEKELRGQNTYERYASFFLTEQQKWRKEVVFMEKKYEKQFSYLKFFFQKEIDAFVLFLKRFKKDIKDICEYFQLLDGKVINIEFLMSDRHNFQGGGIILNFSNKKKVIYKPKSSQTDVFLKKVLNILDLDIMHRILVPKVLDKGEYGWHEYLPYKRYYSEKKLENVYRRIGTMLALCDILNYSDGHSENFICSSNLNFYLVDTETIFTNLGFFKEKINSYYDLSFTGMIPEKNKKNHYVHLLQKNSQPVYFPYRPFLINDCTDRIRIEYRCLAKNNNEKSFPGYQAIQLSKYLPVIKEGLIYGYALIQKYVDQIKDLIKSENLVCRQIIRPTLYYTWVIHKLFHPQNKNIGIYLEKSLCNLESEIAEYEKLYLQYGNIPVFYHHIHERHLYGFDNKVIFKNYFEKTAYEWVESKLNKVGSVDFQKKRLLELTSCLK